MSRTYKYQRRTGRLNRSFDVCEEQRQGDPWKLLAAAVVFQAAVDCEMWTPEIEQPCYNSSSLNGLPYMRKAKLIQFINSDWIEFLLSWQDNISIEAVRENLIRRLTND